MKATVSCVVAAGRENLTIQEAGLAQLGRRGSGRGWPYVAAGLWLAGWAALIAMALSAESKRGSSMKAWQPAWRSGARIDIAIAAAAPGASHRIEAW